jgi:hypothetical protein
VTCVPGVKVAVHVAPQVIPDGLLLTVPLPLPARVTVNVATVRLNVAVTDVFADSFTVQGPVPLHVPPDHPPNTELVPAVAVSVTVVPLLKLALQAVPQLIPAGLLVIVPVPLPAGTIVKVSMATAIWNVAVTD